MSAIPSIDRAVEIVAEAFDRAATTCGTKHKAALVIVSALLDANFLLIHGDELVEVILTAARADNALKKIDLRDMSPDERAAVIKDAISRRGGLQ